MTSFDVQAVVSAWPSCDDCLPPWTCSLPRGLVARVGDLVRDIWNTRASTLQEYTTAKALVGLDDFEVCGTEVELDKVDGDFH